MNWILVLALFSSSNGNYVREFKTEKQCVQAMKDLIAKTQDTSDVKGIACVPETFASIEE